MQEPAEAARVQGSTSQLMKLLHRSNHVGYPTNNAIHCPSLLNLKTLEDFVSYVRM